MKAKGQICSQILEKQRKIASLEYAGAPVPFVCVRVHAYVQASSCKSMCYSR
jgi:hypothetical protein